MNHTNVKCQELTPKTTQKQIGFHVRERGTTYRVSKKGAAK